MTVNQSQLKHYRQIEALRHQARFNFWLVGRRGGKTIGMREDILSNIHKMPPGYGMYYIGPTNSDAIELMWDSLEERLEDHGWDYLPRISKQRFIFSKGRYIQITGAEKVRRVRGRKIYKAFLDEVGFYSKPLTEVWKALRPALSDAKGGCILGTTPPGKATEAYDFYLAALNNPRWKIVHWNTVDNPFIDPEEVEDAKKDLDEKSFRQEYEATWESFAGMVYFSFTESLHIKKQPPVTPDFPIEITFDFNVNPTTLLVAQDDRKMYRFKKEYSLKNASTPDTVRKFCEDHKDLAEKTVVYIYGDATGKARESTTARSDYYFVEDMLKAYGFRYQMKVPGINPQILDRVAYMNGALKNVHGQTKIEIDPACIDLIRDLGSQEIDGRLPSARNNLGHKADAAGYLVYYKQVLERASKSTMIQL